MVGFHWNDEAVVSDRNDLVLYGFAGASHQIFERAGDRRSQPRDVVAYTREFRTCPIVQLSARQNLQADARREAVKLARQRFDRLPEDWPLVPLVQNERARCKSLFAQPRNF